MGFVMAFVWVLYGVCVPFDMGFVWDLVWVRMSLVRALVRARYGIGMGFV